MKQQELMRRRNHTECSWISDLSQLMLQDDDYVIFVANEFFDALPVRSFKVIALRTLSLEIQGWLERMLRSMRSPGEVCSRVRRAFGEQPPSSRKARFSGRGIRV